MSDERDPRPDPDEVDPEAHVDEITEVEAEADAELADVELVHLPHHEVEPEDLPVARPTIAPDTIGTEPAPNHHVDRQRFLVAYLRVALVAAFLVGVLELVLPEGLRDEAAIVMVGVFVAAPLGRIVWLMVRWARRGDWRFAVVGGVLLAVVATGFLAR